jgi:uncharacterized protein with PIN domain
MKADLDMCTTCGSEDIRVEEKDLEFDLPNPSKIRVRSTCMVCHECGDEYFDRNQISELSKKIDEVRRLDCRTFFR